MDNETKSTPTYADAIRPFREAGIPARVLLPIAPVDAKVADTPRGEEFAKNLGKAPGRFYRKSGEWSGLSKDREGARYVVNGVRDERDQNEFAGWPTASVGILGRFAPGIDSDAESEDARRMVEGVMLDVFGREAGFAERLRGKGPRRLYAFAAADIRNGERVVRSRHVHYRLAGEGEGDKLHKIDVIGAGNQYLIAGEHKSGDFYEWHPDYDLCELFRDGLIKKIDNADIERFLNAFTDALEEAGGYIVHSSGGAAPGEERDYSHLDPIMPVKEIFDGLQNIPNDEKNFPTRESLVKVCAAIRAALGAEAEENRYHVEAWATAHGWADGEYFDKVWNSLDRAVRVTRDSLDKLFREHGVFVSARSEFIGDTSEFSANLAREKKAKRSAEDALLDKVRSRYVIGHVNTRTGNKAPQMRSAWDPTREWPAIDWWRHETTQQDVSFVQELRAVERWADPKQGFWTFLRDLESAHPESFYTGETRHPLYPRGDIVVEENPDGTFTREINMRFESRVQIFARKSPVDPRKAQNDLNTILEFIHRVFGKLADYELDTLAYMVQTGKRPGHMLFLVGGQGVGKSIYAEMLISMFDGSGKEINSRIDGTKLTTEAARRFAWAKAEGCRVLSVKELPDGSSTSNMAAITSSLKQIVDPGPDGDYIQIEAKGKDSRTVQNHARIIMTSNYKNAVHIEEQDRRIFYVSCGIIPEDKPGPEYYAALAEVTTKPERLAAVWRYLKGRDISGYRPAVAPPVSREKQEAQIAGMADPTDRHMRAALECYRQAKRSLFDLKEFGSLMSAMSENECANSNGAIDERRSYDFGKMPSAVKRLDRDAEKVRVVKSNGERLATVYALRTARPIIRALASASGPDVMDTLERDRERNRLSSDHVWAVFSGPLKAASSRR